MRTLAVTRSRLAFGTIALVALAAVPSALAGEKLDMEMTFTGDFQEGTFKKSQTWTGEDANKFRKNLDQIFNANNDGVLTEQEIATIMDAAMNDTARNMGNSFFMDGANASVGKTDVQISAQGLLGPVDATYPAMVTHEVRMRFSPSGGARHTFNMTMPVGGNITIHAPDGWSVARAEGLVEPKMASGNASVTGAAAPGANVMVEFSEGRAGPDLSLPGGAKLPAFTALATGAAVGLAALTGLARSRRGAR